MYDDALNNH